MSIAAWVCDPDSHLTVTYEDGFHETIYSSDPNFDAIMVAVVAEDWKVVRNLIEGERIAFTKKVESLGDGEVVIEHGVVYLSGQPIHNTLTNRIVRMAAAGFNIKPMSAFLVNLMANPSYRAVTELYSFLEKSNLPITADGHFLAYKKIRVDWTDVYTGKIDNSIGAVVEMPRNAVNDDRDITCSVGLHFCSREYLRSFGGDRTVIVKINPADVVSIPSDYNDSKGRCCKYVVVQEVDTTNEEQALESTPLAVTKSEKVIQQIQDGIVINEYNTLEEAADATGIQDEYIKQVLNGDRTFTGGFGWEYETRERPEFDLSIRSGDEYDYDDDWGEDEDEWSDADDYFAPTDAADDFETRPSSLDNLGKSRSKLV